MSICAPVNILTVCLRIVKMNHRTCVGGENELYRHFDMWSWLCRIEMSLLKQ